MNGFHNTQTSGGGNSDAYGISLPKSVSRNVKKNNNSYPSHLNNGEYILNLNSITGNLSYYNTSDVLQWSVSAQSVFTDTLSPTTYKFAAINLIESDSKYYLIAIANLSSSYYARLCTIDYSGSLAVIGAVQAISITSIFTPTTTTYDFNMNIDGNDVYLSGSNGAGTYELVINKTTGVKSSESQLNFNGLNLPSNIPYVTLDRISRCSDVTYDADTPSVIIYARGESEKHYIDFNSRGFFKDFGDIVVNDYNVVDQSEQQCLGYRFYTKATFDKWLTGVCANLGSV